MKLHPTERHVCDEHLLLQAAGELPPALLRRVSHHLEHCNDCRTRLQHLVAAEAGSCAVLTTTPLPPLSPAHDRLAGILEAKSKLQARPPQRTLLAGWFAAFRRPAFLLRAAAVLALVVTAVTFQQLTRPLQDMMGAYEETGPEPNHLLTPGSAAPLTVAEICRRTDDDLDPPVPAEQQRAVFRAYRMDERRAKAYQVDYLINPQLGGDSSIQNLWPEPYHATVWNASAKDTLETRLHGMVCSGELPLQMAQHELASDWIATYKKYFHTSRPVRTVATESHSGQP